MDGGFPEDAASSKVILALLAIAIVICLVAVVIVYLGNPGVACEPYC